jgi:phosphoglycerate dehydrogenase-like enzyme
VTPHIGGYTFESLARTEQHLAEKLLAYLGHRADRSEDVADAVPRS